MRDWPITRGWLVGRAADSSSVVPPSALRSLLASSVLRFEICESLVLALGFFVVVGRSSRPRSRSLVGIRKQIRRLNRPIIHKWKFSSFSRERLRFAVKRRSFRVKNSGFSFV